MIDKLSSIKFDLYIILTIASLAWGSYEMLGALTPIRLIGFYGFYVAMNSSSDLYENTFGFSKLFTFWIAYSLFSVVYSYSTSSWLIQFCHTSTLMGAILAIAVWAENAKNPLKSLCYGWLVFVFITVPIAWWELSTGNHLTSGSFNDDTIGALGELKPFAAVTFSNYNSYVVMLCFALPFIFGLWFRGNKIERVLSLFAVIFTFVVLAFNTSRGGILCYVIACSFFFVTIFTRINLVSKIIMLVLLCYFINFIISNSSEFELLEPILRRSDSVGMLNDDSRSDVWYRSFVVAANHLFFGSGTGSMVYVLNDYFPNKLSYCHNYFLETLLEYGLIISVIWFYSIYKILRAIIVSDSIEIKYIALYVTFSAPFLLVIDDYYAQRSGVWIYIASLLVLYNCDKKSYNDEVS